MRKSILTRSRRGFTLIEIMVVVIVLGILAAVIIPNFVGQTDKANVARAQADIHTISTMIQAFRLDMKRVPTQDEGLAVLRTPPSSDDANLWKGPYAQKDISMDPWGAPYQYYQPAPNDIDEFGVASFGADKAPGGDGYAKDVNSWEDYNADANAGGGAPAGGGSGPAPAAPAAPAGGQ